MAANAEGPRGAQAPRTGGGATSRLSGPSASEPTDVVEAAPALPDRSALTTGDEAFQSGQWRTAADSYGRMPAPPSRVGDYAQEYQIALVRRGISYINLGEWERALETLRDAASFDFRDYTAYFYLGQVECALGQSARGRRSLAEIERFTPYISDQQRPIVSVLVDYQRALCSYAEFQRAGDLEREGLADQARSDIQTFLNRAGAMSPIPPVVRGALEDARKRMGELGPGG